MAVERPAAARQPPWKEIAAGEERALQEGYRRAQAKAVISKPCACRAAMSA
jgi:hypothetical protein